MSHVPPRETYWLSNAGGGRWQADQVMGVREKAVTGSYVA